MLVFRNVAANRQNIGFPLSKKEVKLIDASNLVPS